MMYMVQYIPFYEEIKTSAFLNCQPWGGGGGARGMRGPTIALLPQ